MNQTLLSEMAELLESDAINYTVFLKWYCCAADDVATVDDVMRKLLGPGTVVEQIKNCSLAQVEDDIAECLGYAGDEGDGPGPVTLGTQEYAILLDEIKGDVAEVCSCSREIKSLRIAAGHPAYPVFWDFAYLFLGKEEHRLIVGSVSD